MQDGKSKKRSRYPDEVRQRVLARLASGETSLRQLSQETKISAPTLVNWRKAERSAVSDPAPHPTATDENSQLRREIERLKQERDWLLRAIVRGVKIAD